MLGDKQIEETIVINAPVEDVFAVLDDSSHLAQWVPAVSRVTKYDEGGEQVGAVRHCEAALGGKTGKMVEEVIDRKEGRSLTYKIAEETFGMAKMFKGYGFRTSVEPIGNSQTRAKIETHYTPANPLFSLMNAVMMRRQFRGIVKGILGGLKEFSENRT